MRASKKIIQFGNFTMFNNTDEPVLDLKLWKSYDDEFDIDAIQSWGVIERDDREYKLQVVWNDAYDVSIY